MSRYKHFNWDAAYKRNTEQAKTLFLLPNGTPKALVGLNAHLLLVSIHHGPWRAIWWQIRRELSDVWLTYGWMKWEWIRVKVLRRRPDEAIEMCERLNEEEFALEEMMQSL